MFDYLGSLRLPRSFIIGFFVFYFASVWLIFQKYHPRDSTHAASSTSNSAFSDIRNATLGFGKVFVINMKERTDKLDAIHLAASLTGFHLDVIEGVIGGEISPRTLPPKGVPKKEEWKEHHFSSIAGCWRSHLNFAQRVVSENLGSALVMEDDVDWSVYLKDQLEQLGTGTRYITDPTSQNDINLESPYGNDWDMLWIGHCGSSFRDSAPHYVIENDPTVPPVNHRPQQNTPDFASSGYDNNTRVVYTAGGGLCTQGYALSLRGARKLIQHYLYKDGFAPIDLGLHEICKDQNMGFKCLAIFPTLLASHRAAGPTNRDSDIMLGIMDAPIHIREKGETYNVVHSTRLNVETLLTKGMEGITPQWDDIPPLTGGVRTKFV